MHTRAFVAIASAALLTSAALGGCSSDPDGNGQVALGRSGGHTVVLLDVCHGSTNEVEVSADRQGLRDDEANPVLGSLRTASPVTGRAVVDLEAPGSAWQSPTPVRLPSEAGRGVIVTARGSDGATEMTQTNALVSQLDTLKPGQVIVTDPGSSTSAGRIVTEAQFHAGACPR